jgi:PhzF family phenazine biosynthesis protein
LQVDAFSEAPFGGNPAAVVLLTAAESESLDDATRQKIAAEMNLSETSFVDILPENTSCHTSRSGSFPPLDER